MARTTRHHEGLFNSDDYGDRFKRLFMRGKIRLSLIEGWFRNSAFGWKYEDVWNARAKKSIKNMLRRRDRKRAKMALKGDSLENQA